MKYIQTLLSKGFLISLATVLVPILFQFFYIRYISYHVDKVDYGNFVLLQTLIAGLSYIFIQIPSHAYDRFFNTAKDKIIFVNEFRTLLIFINVLSLIGIYIYGISVDKFSIEVLFVLFLYFILLNNYSFNQRIFLLNLDRKKYFLLRVFESLAKFILPLISYYLYPTLLGFLCGIVLGYLISIIILLAFLKGYPFKFVTNLTNLKKYLTFAYPMLLVSSCTWGISFSDRYFIEFMDSTKELGIYAILAQVAGIGQIFGQIFTIYINPKVLNLFEGNPSSALSLLNRSLRYIIFLFIMFAIVSYFLPSQIYSILIEQETIQNSYYFNTFYLLLIGIFVTVLQTCYSMYLNLYKRLDLLGYIYIVALIVNIGGNFFIMQYGIIAAALSTLCAYLIILFGQMLVVKNLLINH